jgi:hypothetical protein
MNKRNVKELQRRKLKENGKGQNANSGCNENLKQKWLALTSLSRVTGKFLIPRNATQRLTSRSTTVLNTELTIRVQNSLATPAPKKRMCIRKVDVPHDI